MSASPMRRAFAAALVALLALATSACSRGAARPRHEVEGGDVERGRIRIGAYGCGNCHSIPGVPGANGTVGPPLDAYAERTYIAGALRNRPDELVRWIVNPQLIEPGTAMPDLGVKEADARDIAAYLYSLQEGGLGPPHLVPSWVIGGP